jgi:hypothetical protein
MTDRGGENRPAHGGGILALVARRPRGTSGVDSGERGLARHGRRAAALEP